MSKIVLFLEGQSKTSHETRGCFYQSETFALPSSAALGCYEDRARLTQTSFRLGKPC